MEEKVCNASPEQTKGLEEIFEQIEEIVQELEEGSLGLEESLELFAQGVKLCRVGEQKLKDAEQIVEQLLEDSETGEISRELWSQEDQEEG
ncbi:MAG: exodeoxyribonuclease VII small subunit [Myxococcota bacterium]